METYNIMILTFFFKLLEYYQIDYDWGIAIKIVFKYVISSSDYDIKY